MINFSVLQRLFEKMIGIGYVPIEILNISTICILNFIVDLHTNERNIVFYSIDGITFSSIIIIQIHRLMTELLNSMQT